MGTMVPQAEPRTPRQPAQGEGRLPFASLPHPFTERATKESTMSTEVSYLPARPSGDGYFEDSSIEELTAAVDHALSCVSRLPTWRSGVSGGSA